MSMTEDSVAMVTQAQKTGATRKFVLVTKGTQVVSLVAYKKGAVDKHIKQAKSVGTGEVTYGVLTGSGQILTFTIAKADGFSEQPVSDANLKKYLAACGIPSKPSFEVVEVAPLSLDADDPLHAQFLGLQTRVSEAIDRHPDQASALQTLWRQTGSHLDADQVQKGTEKLAELVALLERLSAANPAQAEYDKLRTKLEPLFNAAKRAAPDRATKLSSVWEYAAEEASGGNYAKATKALNGLTDALKAILAQGAKSDAARFSIPENLVAERRRLVLSHWQQAVGEMRAEVAKLQRAIAIQLPDVDAAAIGEGVQRVIDRFCAELNETVTANTSTDGAAVDAERILKMVRKYQQSVDGSEHLKVLGESKGELGVEVDVAGCLRRSLQQIETALAN